MSWLKGLCLSGLLATAGAGANPVEMPQIFSVASGYAGGMYYKVSSALSVLLSHPPHSLPCQEGGGCGVPNLVLSNISSEGSLANLKALQRQHADSAFMQSDIAYWAYSGTGLFTADHAAPELRAIASFYPEMLHLIVRTDSDIDSVQDLRGKRVALGAKHSGTLVNVRQLLAVNGLSEQSVQGSYEDVSTAAADFLAQKIDAFFFVGGVPTPLIARLADETDIRIIPIRHDDELYENNHYYARAEIPAGSYRGVDQPIPTVSVRALWITRADADEKQIYQLTKTLWQATDKRPYWLPELLPAQALQINHALDGIGIPLHPGAKRFYDEIGKRF